MMFTESQRRQTIQTSNKHVDQRLSSAEAKKQSQFREESQSGIDVEYRKTLIERVILTSVYNSQEVSKRELEYNMDELARLAITAGAEILDRFTQPRDTPSATSYFGKGACENLKNICCQLEVDTVITNDSLEPRQRRNLENLIDTKVIDRTELILDIFAQHASSKAGRAQVELAQLEYLLPRLRGWGQALSRQGGGQVGGGAGMGSRGPGETQLEIDRRRITQKLVYSKNVLQRLSLNANKTVRIARRHQYRVLR